jgi:hypothetical protein
MPNRFNRINPGSKPDDQMNQINQNFAKLDQETVIKKFGSSTDNLSIGKVGDNQLGMKVVQDGNQAIVFGKYKDDRYGMLLYQDGVPILLIGQAPDDGRMGSWQVKTGYNVLTELGG